MRFRIEKAYRSRDDVRGAMLTRQVFRHASRFVDDRRLSFLVLMHLQPRPHCLKVDYRSRELYKSTKLLSIHTSINFWRRNETVNFHTYNEIDHVDSLRCRLVDNVCMWSDCCSYLFFIVPVKRSRPIHSLEISTCRRFWRRVEVDK
jgi:hypothetical protein